MTNCKSHKILCFALVMAGIILCYFVWFWNWLSIICLLLIFTGVGLCRKMLSSNTYYFLLLFIVLCLFPVLNFCGLILIFTMELLLRSFDTPHENDRGKRVKAICRKILILAACIGLNYASIMWLGALCRKDCEIKTGERVSICFPYSGQSFSIGYGLKDKSIPADTVFHIVIKNTASGAETRIKLMGQSNMSGFNPIHLDANTEYLIFLENIQGKDTPCKIIIQLPSRASDPFFMGFHNAYRRSDFIKVSKADA